MGFKEIKMDCIRDLVAMRNLKIKHLDEREARYKNIPSMKRVLDDERLKLKFIKVLINMAKKIQKGDLI